MSRLLTKSGNLQFDKKDRIGKYNDVPPFELVFLFGGKWLVPGLKGGFLIK